MTANEQLIHHFYTSFKNKDVKAMQDCYADTASFNDPIFTDLSAAQVRMMWAMLLKSGKDMRIEFQNIKETQSGTTAEWTAWYTFSATGNKVRNQIKASFVIENRKIVKHTDRFSFYQWARQALGLTGLLLGWTGFLRNKISTTAKKKLESFMSSNVD